MWAHSSTSIGASGWPLRSDGRPSRVVETIFANTAEMSFTLARGGRPPPAAGLDTCTGTSSRAYASRHGDVRARHHCVRRDAAVAIAHHHASHVLAHASERRARAPSPRGVSETRVAGAETVESARAPHAHRFIRYQEQREDAEPEIEEATTLADDSGN